MYTCPNCGGKASRGWCDFSGTCRSQWQGGAVGAILGYIFTFPFHCRSCERNYRLADMPGGTLARALLGTLVGLGIAAGLVYLLLRYVPFPDG